MFHDNQPILQSTLQTSLYINVCFLNSKLLNQINLEKNNFFFPKSFIKFIKKCRRYIYMLLFFLNLFVIASISDTNECELILPPCGHGACINLKGSYFCISRSQQTRGIIIGTYPSSYFYQFNFHSFKLISLAFQFPEKLWYTLKQKLKYIF